MNSREPSCPRCGYDQSGIIASWQAECPLDGVCSECGLEFPWSELLSEKQVPPAWSFEHGKWVSPVRWGASHGRALGPRSFWSKLRMTHEVRVPRLVLSMLMWIALCHVLVSGATVLRLYRGADAMIAKNPAWRLPPFNPAWRPSNLPGTVTPMQLMWKEVAAVAVWPYGMRQLQWPSYLGMRRAPVAGYGLAALAVAVVMIPPGFLVLGDTFRKCKVRFVHLVRGAAYSFAGPGLAAVIGIVASALGVEGWLLLAPVGLLWLAVYWLRFARGYLRLTHAIGVVAAMLTISGLCVAITLTLMWVTRTSGW